MDPPNNPLENVLFEGVVIPVVIRPFRKKSFAFVKSYLERIVKNLPKAKNCFCMFETLQLFCALLGWGNTLSNVTRTPWSHCLLLFFTVGNLEESVATDKPSQKFRTDEEIVRGDTEQKDGGKWGLFPCKWIQQQSFEISEDQLQIQDS